MTITPEHVKAARGLLDWSQSDLARSSGVSRQTIVDFERGERTPKERSILAMQTALEKSGIEFSQKPDGSVGAELRHSIWKLTPINLNSIHWTASTHRSEVIIRAVSERRARQIASLAFLIAVRHVPGQEMAINPWNKVIGEASCERLVDSEFDERGSEAILSPSQSDQDWRF
mgnify:CR=1 FL=1